MQGSLLDTFIPLQREMHFIYRKMQDLVHIFLWLICKFVYCRFSLGQSEQLLVTTYAIPSDIFYNV